MPKSKLNYETAEQLVLTTLDHASSDLARRLFQKNNEKIIENLKLRALENDRLLSSCRVPLIGGEPGQGKWYISPIKIPENWNTVLINESEQLANNKIHRVITRHMKELFKEKYVRRLINQRFFSRIVNEGVRITLSRLSERVMGFDITLLNDVLKSHAEIGSIGLQVALSTGTEYALSYSLAEDIIKENQKLIKESGQAYGGIEIPKRLHNSLEIYSKEYNSKISVSSAATITTNIFITEQELKDFDHILNLDRNFFACPSSSCGFDLNFTHSCEKARDAALYEIETEYLSRYRMSTSYERGSSQLYPIYQLVEIIRHGNYTQGNIPKDPLRPLIGD